MVIHSQVFILLQAVGIKDVTASDLTAKRLKGETQPDHAKAETSNSSPRDSMTTENTSSAEHAVPHTSSSNPTVPVQEPLKASLRPLAPVGAPFVANRFKLDNRPTAFRIVSPLPSGLANVSFAFFSINCHTYFSLWMKISSISLLF